MSYLPQHSAESRKGVTTMTIDEAIKTMSERFSDPLRKFDDDYFEAIKLGIEALREIKESRRHGYTFVQVTLPGETVVGRKKTQP